MSSNKPLNNGEPTYEDLAKQFISDEEFPGFKKLEKKERKQREKKVKRWLAYLRTDAREAWESLYGTEAEAKAAMREGDKLFSVEITAMKCLEGARWTMMRTK